ncbi:MAG: hypothetical protein DRN33_02170 [Thermoplasmata archaeon]|jgi:hypothetical protein|nr:MAG: hypothetical protein FE043_01000 [Thermoplasmata archaeon]RLF64459.1 MAG: hypothetical protein DRN33_02170 [Thermoplasmata archaeon]
MPGIMRRDKVLVELIALLLIFMVLYVFSSDLVWLMKYAGDASSNIKPVEAFFMFFAYIFQLFSDIKADIVMYMVGSGVIILNGRR